MLNTKPRALMLNRMLVLSRGSGMKLLQDHITEVHHAAAAASMKQLHQGAFGRIGERLDGKLQAAMDRNLQDTLNKNEILSSRACDALESTVRSSRCSFC